MHIVFERLEAHHPTVYNNIVLCWRRDWKGTPIEFTKIIRLIQADAYPETNKEIMILFTRRRAQNSHHSYTCAMPGISMSARSGLDVTLGTTLVFVLYNAACTSLSCGVMGHKLRST